MLPMSSADVQPGAVETQSMKILAPPGVRYMIRVSSYQTGRANHSVLTESSKVEDSSELYGGRRGCPGPSGLCWVPGEYDQRRVVEGRGEKPHVCIPIVS